MKRYFSPVTSKNISLPSSSSTTNVIEQKDDFPVPEEVNPEDIIFDPGLRKSINDYDINIRDQVRRSYLIKGPTQTFGYSFPRKQHGARFRSFREDWFNKFDWLEYSVAKDAAFCFYCYLFKQKATDVFTKTGCSNWKNAIQIFNEHIGAVDSYHNNARQMCDNFKNQRQSISQVFVSHSNEQQIEYKSRLSAVVDVIKYLLIQGLAFRGHDESSLSKNKGNFLELLEWYADKCEDVARVCNENAPGNNKMTSPQIQKEIVKACAEETLQIIMKEIGNHLFSVLVDESRDISVKEQMAVIVRYVNDKGYVIERFIGIEHVTDTSARSLKAALDNLFGRRSLSICNLRGQGYDGASNMKGEFNGLKALILEENPRAFYVHCFAHQLQLVIVRVASSNRRICDFFDHVTMIVNIVGASCKRKDALLQKHHDNIVNKLESCVIFPGRGKHQETSLAKPGDTRWGSHYTTLIRLLGMWDAVLEVLMNVHDDGTDHRQQGTSSGLISRMDTFEFVFILHLMVKVLGITNELSQALQMKDQNIINAMSLIDNVKDRFQHLRENEWNDFLDSVSSFCCEKSISVPNMEDRMTVYGRPTRKGQFINCNHFYHIDLYIGTIDMITSEMRTRFNETSTELLNCIACLNPRDSFDKFDVKKLCRLAELYSDDFSIFECITLKEQLITFLYNIKSSSEFSECQDIASLAVKMVKTDKHWTFPLVYRLIELALILPVATASVERVFSAMNIIKTDLRNKMSDDWMNDMMICYIERDIFKNVAKETILQHFQSMKTRRIQMPRIS